MLIITTVQNVQINTLVMELVTENIIQLTSV
jgi:hypothetical protein